MPEPVTAVTLVKTESVLVFVVAPIATAAPLFALPALCARAVPAPPRSRAATTHTSDRVGTDEPYPTRSRPGGRRPWPPPVRAAGVPDHHRPDRIGPGDDTRPGPRPAGRRADLSYSTVVTILTRLHAKGAVIRERHGRAYRYAAVRDAAGLVADRMARLLAAESDRGSVLRRFVGSLDAEDEQILRSLLHDETE